MDLPNNYEHRETAMWIKDCPGRTWSGGKW